MSRIAVRTLLLITLAAPVGICLAGNTGAYTPQTSRPGSPPQTYKPQLERPSGSISTYQPPVSQPPQSPTLYRPSGPTYQRSTR